MIHPYQRLTRLLLLVVTAFTVAASTAAAQNVTLAWNANPESNIAGYRVQYGTQSGSPSATVDVGRVTSRLFTGLTVGTRYYFRVLAYTTTGQTSAPSSEVSHVVPSSTTTSAPTIGSVSPTSGPLAGGTQITIAGTNFVSGARVLVGGRSATTTFVGSTQLRASTPTGAAAAAVAVQVTNPNGQSATRSNAFTYIASSGAAPSINSVSPTSGPTAGGTMVTVMGANFVSGARVLFGGRAATTTFVSSSQVRASTPTGAAAGAVAVQVVNPNGLSATRGSAFTYVGGTSGGYPSINSVSPTSGPRTGGTLITVTGSNFVSGARVNVGGRAATTSFVNSTTLRASTPSAAATGPTSIQVVLPNGLSASRGNAFTYLASSSSTTTSMTSAATLASETSGDADTSSPEGTVDPHLAMLTAAEIMNSVAQNAALSEAAATDDARRLPTDPTARYRRVLAGGASTETMQTRLALANAESVDAAVALSFTDTTGKTTRLPVTVPARQRRTVDLSTIAELQGTTFSIALESDRPVSLERLMTWGRSGSASSLTAAPEPATRWYFADGSTSKPFELSYEVHNPGATDADLEIRYLLPGGGEPVVRRHVVAAGRVESIRVDREDAALADTDVAAEIVSVNDVPVVVERSQYLVESGETLPQGGDKSAGVSSPATSWWLEGATGQNALFVLLANPSEEAAVAQVTYFKGDGSRLVRRHDVSAGGRTTIDVAREDASLANASLGIHVESLRGTPLVVERAAWWGADGKWTDGLTGGAVREPAARWLLAEGEEGGAHEASTSLSIFNAASRDTTVRVTLLFEGAREVSTTFTLKGTAQLAAPIARMFPDAAGRRFAVLIESVTGTPSLVVDRGLFSPAAEGGRAGASSPAIALPSR
jgi:hypothetical protein